MPPLLLPLLLLMFGVQSSVSMLITRSPSIPHLKTPGGLSCSSRATSTLATLQSSSCREGDPARDKRPLDFIEAARDMRPSASALETRGSQVGAGWLSREALTASSKRESHLTLGPVLASWGFAAATLACQARFTDWAQLQMDAAAVWSLLPADAATAIAGREVLALFPLVWISAMSYAFFVMQSSFPPQQIEGTSTPKQVPLRNAKMVKHRLAAVDFSCAPYSTTTLGVIRLGEGADPC